MKKRNRKVISLLMASALAASLAACGSSSSTESADASSESTAAASSAAEEDASAEETAEEETSDSEEGAVLNIEVWNNEFCNRLADHYPGFEANDPKDSTKGGKIGDVTVNFIVTDNQDNKYQTKLDEDLLNQDSAADDDKVDIFLIEADYALKYVDADADVAMPLSELGITEDDLAKQYQYTKDVVTDANGEIRGASWQACSAGLIFNREIAQEVLGTDDLEEVQEAVSDWDTFTETAEKMKDAGYKMTATVNDTYRVYSNNVSGPWVQDGAVVVDDNITAWTDDSKEMVDAEETTTNELWSDEWSAGFQAPGDVFCYFGPAWLINFSMGNAPESEDGDDGSIAYQGGWGFVNGPQGYYWGGTWICAAQGTDNESLVKDIILTMTTDNDVMKEIAVDDSDCVNNSEVLEELAADEDAGISILGGQNPYQVLADGAEAIDMSNISPYDQGCNEEYQTAMKNYFDGNATYEEALEQFKKAVVEKYPELTTD